MSIKTKAKYFLAFGMFNIVLYFLVQNYVTAHKQDLMMEIDSAIPFMPEYVWIYHTLIPVIFVSFLTLYRTRKDFFIALWSGVLATVVLNCFYLLLPSFYPRDSFEVVDLATSILYLTREVDGANNTFPSGHVCFAWLTFWCVLNSKVAQSFKGLRSLYLLWAIGISLSTLVLKQHYVVDVFSGFVLSYMSYFLAKEMVFYFNRYRGITPS